MAEGANVPLQSVAEWAYIEECDAKQCSGAIYRFGDQVWVARNNDFYMPDLWGYVTIREIDGRIPAIDFCMEGEIFAPTGINKEKLWLHYNFLPVWDKPAPNKPHLPSYVFLTEALEVCRTIAMERIMHLHFSNVCVPNISVGGQPTVGSLVPIIIVHVKTEHSLPRIKNHMVR